MTTSLEHYYGEPVNLSVLQHFESERRYCREILLSLMHSAHVVEYGLVRLNLDTLSADVREEVLNRECPLGEILIRHDVLRRIEPMWYVAAEDNASFASHFGTGGSSRLYGRVGIIHYQNEPVIELLEIVRDQESPAKANSESGAVANDDYRD